MSVARLGGGNLGCMVQQHIYRWLSICFDRQWKHRRNNNPGRNEGLADTARLSTLGRKDSENECGKMSLMRWWCLGLGNLPWFKSYLIAHWTRQQCHF